MAVWQSLVLGVVQGLTEFLPVSSSGHLVIFQHLFGMKEAPLTFDVLVHLGTLLAVLLAFREDLLYILRRPFNRLTYLIIVGCIPAALAGFLLAPLFEKAFESLLVVGIGLVFTGFILKFSEAYATEKPGLKEINETGYADAIFIGLLQALAIVPGISRSGSTIASGLFVGLDREFAARFSFLLSIPVIIGAGVFELKDVMETGISSSVAIPYAAGFAAAVLSGYLAIKLVLRIVKKGKLSMFSYYCWGLAGITLLAYFIL